MPLFVVKHQHDADRCPAGDPEQGPKLLEYLSDPAASGITVYAQAMADWQHTLHMILEASDVKSVLDFLAPLILHLLWRRELRLSISWADKSRHSCRRPKSLAEASARSESLG